MHTILGALVARFSGSNNWSHEDRLYQEPAEVLFPFQATLIEKNGLATSS